MTTVDERLLIGLDEAALDTAIYRIYRVGRFEAMLASGEDALVNPGAWDDPFENFFLQRTEVMDDASGMTIPLTNLAADWYGQCWSLNEETDAMWRIYSPNPTKRRGVKVKTTIRRLLQNLLRAGSPAPYLQFFVGLIEYRRQEEIVDLMRRLTFMDSAAGGGGHNFASLMCIKREAFDHEREVRLLFQDMDTKRATGGLFRYALDPHALFDEVVLDPRLNDSAALRLKKKLQKAGCRLPIKPSALYQAPRFVIRSH